MEVALVLDRFDPRHGGLENWAFQYASWLGREGQHVHIVAAACAPAPGSVPFRLHSLDPSKDREGFASAAENFLRRLRPDVVHDLGSGWYYDILQPQFGSRLADARQNLLTFPWLERWRLRCSRSARRRLRRMREFERRQYTVPGGRVVAVSALTRSHLQHFNRVPAGRIDLVPNGVSPDDFAPAADPAGRSFLRRKLRLDDGCSVLLFAAHNFRLKGLAVLLQALRRLRAEPLHALIVGRGEVEKYERLARRLRVDRQVTFCGFVEEIRDYHHVADFLVHPTFYDPCSLAVLEALASGLPVITTRENGAAESMTPGVEGFVVRAGHAGELAAAIRLLLDPATRARMSVAARAAALRQTSEQSFRRLFELYHHIQASGQGRDSRSWQ